MQTKLLRTVFTLSTLIAVLASAVPALAAYRLADVTVVVPQGASPMVKLAGDELRHYVYLLTGSLPRYAEKAEAGKAAIVLRSGPGEQLPAGGADPKQNYALYKEDGRQVVHGASDAATLWAAYHLIESWGVGFYLGEDCLPKPDARIQAELVEAKAQPALAIRGNLPWFNFMNSPTTWNPQDYKTFFAQMAKQKANFIGFHAYDHEPFGAYDITNEGAKMGGPLMTTISPHRWWSPPAMATSDFLFGTDQFFNRGEWGCEVGIDDGWSYAPGRATRLQQEMMAGALAYAQRLGIRTCLGYEVTGNPGDPKVREAFRARLKHTLETYPLDYFWIWQSEGRGTAGEGGNWVAGAPNDDSIAPDDKIKEAFGYLGAGHDMREPKRIAEYVLLAHKTLKELAPNVRLIVSGWGGDAHMKFSTLYIGLDKVVPKDVIFSSLDNIDPRQQDHVSEAYGKVGPDRECWPIPWFESDGGHARCDQTGPETNVTAFEPLLKDIVKKGCRGALGIHWRTRNVEDVAGYLYRFGWNAQLTAAEYFRGYARDQYGPKDADAMQKVHLQLEEWGPQYVGATGTIECATPFQWFWKTDTADRGHEPNMAGWLPIPERLPKLDAMARDLMARSDTAAKDGRPSAAVAYHDLSEYIKWLSIRARVGMAIWNADAPLEKKLRQGEELLAAGKRDEARKVAEGVASELQTLGFRDALQGLASTCRTRGELGMLATANSRYGRFYAEYVARITRILGRPYPEALGAKPWTARPVTILYPVPNYVAADEAVCFDLVSLLPETAKGAEIALKSLDKTGAGISVPVQNIGRGYHRAVFEPPGSGVWAWEVKAKGVASEFPSVLKGVLTVGPAAGPVNPVLVAK